MYNITTLFVEIRCCLDKLTVFTCAYFLFSSQMARLRNSVKVMTKYLCGAFANKKSMGKQLHPVRQLI